MSRQTGVNSLEVGVRLAALLAETGLPWALKDLAAAAGMRPAKAHRYLVSLIRAGLAERDTGTTRYRLGPMALQLGLSALRGLDVMKFGGEAVAELRAEIDETVMLTIWGNYGPVVARWEESNRPVVTNVRAGWVMPLSTSATGRLFAAYLPTSLTKPLLKKEFAQKPSHRAKFPALLEEIRQTGLSPIEGDLLRGVSGVAAPVFGFNGTIVAALTAVGIQGIIDVRRNGPVAKAVEQAANRLSIRIGFAGSGAVRATQNKARAI